MKCKCCKCYKELEEKEQVKEEHAVWCQDCHYRYRMYEWFGLGAVILLAFLVFSLILFYTSKNDDDKDDDKD